MSDPRILGLTLMAVAIVAFLGSTSEALPPETFFPAMALFAIGAFKFLRSNHEAMAKAEQRAKNAVSPKIRENRLARALADKQAAAKAIGLPPSTRVEPMASSDTSDEMATEMATDVNAIELDDASGNEEELNVTTDVSFPVEVQTGDALADQLGKLNRLLEQGVLTEEEYAIAKTKLLG